MAGCEACGDPLDGYCHSCAEYMKAASPPKSGIVGGNHALLTGNIIGALTKVQELADIHVPRDAEGNYENYFFIIHPSGKWRVTVTPEDVQEE